MGKSLRVIAVALFLGTWAVVVLDAKLNVSSLSAISADLGAATAGSIDVSNSGDHIWLNPGSGVAFAAGGASVGSAPFYVSATGFTTQTYALWASQDFHLTYLSGSGNRSLCVDNNNRVYAGTPTC